MERLVLLSAVALVLAASSRGQSGEVFEAPKFVCDSLGVHAATVQELLLPPGRRDAFRVHLSFGGARRELELRAHDVRSPDFRLLVDEGGELRQVPTPDPVTYRGGILGEPGSIVAATVVDGQLRAEILGAGRRWTVQPASDAGPDLPGTAHLVFERSDVQQVPFACATVGGREQPAPIVLDAGVTAAATSLQIADVAIDADHQFYVNRGGSTTAVQDDITGIINVANAIYTRDVGIEHRITAMIVRTEPTYLANGEPLLFEFQSRWNLVHNDIPRHVAHLFSGRSAGPAIGLAFPFSVCDPTWGYGVSWSDFSANLSLRVGLTAHELGHNWGAQHCDPFGECRIMCSAINACSGDTTRFGPTSVTAIEAFKRTLGCLISENVCVAHPSGIVSSWPGDGHAGDTVGGNGGGLRNGAAFAAGLVGSAFAFDGLNDFVRVEDSPSLDLGAHSIEAWINPDVQLSPYFHGIAVKQNPDGSGRNFYLGLTPEPARKVHYSISFPSPYVRVNSAQTVPTGVWTHVAATYDGRWLRIYINGQLDASLDLGESVPENVPGTNGQPLTIGYSNESVFTPTFFKGLIDELAIYSGALTAEQVREVFRAGSAGRCESPASFVGIGTGCAGSAGIPRLANVPGLLPRIGEGFALQLTGIPALGDPLVFAGVERADPALDLASLGLTGCQAFIRPLISQALTNRGGVAYLVAPIPDEASLIGLSVLVQCLVPDPGANPGDFTVSNAGEILIGAK